MQNFSENSSKKSKFWEYKTQRDFSASQIDGLT